MSADKQSVSNTLDMIIDPIAIREFINEFLKHININPDNICVKFRVGYRDLEIDVFYRPMMLYRVEKIGYKKIGEDGSIIITFLHEMLKDLLSMIERETNEKS